MPPIGTVPGDTARPRGTTGRCRDKESARPLSQNRGLFTRIGEYVPLATPESLSGLRHQLSSGLGNVSSTYKRHVPPSKLTMPYHSAQEAKATFIPSSTGNLTLVLIRSLAPDTSMSQG